MTFGNRSDNNFWTVRNFFVRPLYFRKYTFRAWIWTQILYFFVGNQESYCRLNSPHRVTRTVDSNYVPVEGRKNGSLTFWSRNWLGNIFFISRDRSSQNQFFSKKICYWLVVLEPQSLRKCFEKWPTVTVSTIAFERYRIFIRGLDVLDRTHS